MPEINYYCLVHKRPATFKYKKSNVWKICCDPELGGIMSPCYVVKIEEYNDAR